MVVSNVEFRAESNGATRGAETCSKQKKTHKKKQPKTAQMEQKQGQKIVFVSDVEFCAESNGATREAETWSKKKTHPKKLQKTTKCGLKPLRKHTHPNN